MEIVKSHEQGMKLALQEAKKAFALGEVPVGAIIINKAGEVIGRGHNLCELHNLATLHAEMVAIAAASKKINNWRLTDCTMYVTLEPCAMCAGAIINARLSKLVYGASDYRAGGCDSIFNIVHHPALSHQVETISTVLEDQCLELLKIFFKQQRINSRK